MASDVFLSIIVSYFLETAPVPEESLDETVPSVIPQPVTSTENVPAALEPVEKDVPEIRQRTQASHASEMPTVSTSLPADNILINKTSLGQNVSDPTPDMGKNDSDRTPVMGKNDSLSLLVLTAVLTITLLLLGYGQLIGNNVFLPFMVYEIFSTILSKEENDQPGTLINMILMLFKLSREKVLQLAKILQKCQRIFQDFCVYISIVVIFFQIFKLNE